MNLAYIAQRFRRAFKPRPEDSLLAAWARMAGLMAALYVAIIILAFCAERAGLLMAQIIWPEVTP